MGPLPALILPATPEAIHPVTQGTIKGRKPEIPLPLHLMFNIAVNFCPEKLNLIKFIKKCVVGSFEDL